jgi:ABC-type molybdenum transport system ATPase subunit/photorepair protein PhrA
VSGASIELRDVGFSHGPRAILTEVTATVGPRSRVAVVGPNGVG